MFLIRAIRDGAELLLLFCDAKNKHIILHKDLTNLGVSKGRVVLWGPRGLNILL